MRQRLVIALCLAGMLLATVGAGAALASTRASLPDIERQVMCVSCKIPLNTAESPQADRERAFIQGLIDQGQTTSQIKRALVAEYGRAVLATPSGHGFGLTAYLVPVAVVAGVLALLAAMVPRWRRRGTSAGPDPGAAVPELAPADSARLDADLARFDR